MSAADICRPCKIWLETLTGHPAWNFARNIAYEFKSQKQLERGGPGGGVELNPLSLLYK